MAYLFLLIQACTGLPTWRQVINKGYISIDLAIWSCLNLYAHGSTFLRLLGDEFIVKLDDDEEALWRMFYRHSGLTKLLFRKFVIKNFHLVEHSKDTTLETEKYFYIVLDGAVQVNANIGDKSIPLTLDSGKMFDIKHLHLTKQKTLFGEGNLIATTIVESRIFQCSKEDLNVMYRTPKLKDVLQTLLIQTLTEIAERPWKERQSIKNTYDEENNDEFTNHEGYFHRGRDPIFHPLEEWEEPVPFSAGSGSAFYFLNRHIWHSMTTSFLLPWPFMKWIPGTRHYGSDPPRKESNE